MVGFSTSRDFALHDTRPGHPERPDRIRAIARAVREAGLIDSPDPFPDFQIDLQLQPLGGQKLLEIEPSPADVRWVMEVHPTFHVERVRRVCQVGGVLDQGDTSVMPASFDTALLASGAVLKCCDAVMEGKVRRAFAAVRPPGHHAEPERAMGFCLFSNVAIAARYLQRKHGLRHVAIVDFDVHHGNGTQSVFDADPSVLFISLHQHPRTCYPGSGYDWEMGQGAARGTKINIPMMPGAGNDEYRQAMAEQVLPALDHFAPEFLLLSAGFDAHRDDPLAQIELSEDGFGSITRSLADWSLSHCGGRIVSVLEGGYNLRALGRCVVRHLVELREQP